MYNVEKHDSPPTRQGAQRSSKESLRIIVDMGAQVKATIGRLLASVDNNQIDKPSDSNNVHSGK